MDYRQAARQTPEEVCAALRVTEQGLTDEAAAARRAKQGFNSLPEPTRIGLLHLCLKQLRSPLIWLLGLAALISWFVGEITDGFVILATTVLNAIIGVSQELQSARIMADLRQLTRPTALVSRQGHNRTIPAEQLVEGDVILLEEGARIPADARLLTSFGLLVDESTFTGESLPVEKEAAARPPVDNTRQAVNCVFQGTNVLRGRGAAVVFATGPRTQLGELAVSLESAAPPPSPLEVQVAALTKLFVRIIGGVLVVMLLVGWINQLPAETLLLTAISVAVAALPEGLPLLLTVVLVFGIRQLAQQRALVRRTEAVETLGQVQLLLTDKTGTLTKNQLAVHHVVLPTKTGYQTWEAKDVSPFTVGFSRLWRVLFYANDSSAHSWQEHPDPVDRAAMGFAHAFQLETTKTWRKLGEFPFDSETKIMATVFQVSPRKAHVFLKGAPHELLALCRYANGPAGIRTITPKERRHIQQAWQQLAGVGEKIVVCADLDTSPEEWHKVERSRAGALKLWQGRATLLGIVSFSDEIRAETRRTIAQAQRAGIRVVMATGDNSLVAEAVGAQVGLSGNALSELPRAAKERAVALSTTNVFAGVTPTLKLELVQAWQKQGLVVAMTGDGVNDTPALSAADCGLCLGRTGTDLAKDASDIVLLDDNLKTVIKAVEQGRTTFRNIQRVIAFLLATNLAELSVIILATLTASAWPLPLLPVQILWVNLVTDSFSIIPLALEPAHEDTMRRPPRGRRDPLLTSLVKGHIVTSAVAITFATLVSYGLALHRLNNLDQARTVAFLVLVGSQLFGLLTTRSLKQSAFAPGQPRNPATLWIFGLGWLLQILIVLLPATRHWLRLELLPPTWWAGAVLCSTFVFIALEVRKIVFLRPAT